MTRSIPEGNPIKFKYVEGTKNFTTGDGLPLDLNEDGSPKQVRRGEPLSDRMKVFIEEMTHITGGNETGEFTRGQYQLRPDGLQKKYIIDTGTLKHAIEYGTVEAVEKDGKGTWNGRTAVFKLTGRKL